MTIRSLHFKFVFFLKRFVYVFLERGKEGERERERETSMCGCLSCLPLGTWLATQACVLTRIEPRTLWFAAQKHSTTEPHQPGHKLSFFLCDLQIIWVVIFSTMINNTLFPNNLLLKVLVIYNTCLNQLFHFGLQNEWRFSNPSIAYAFSRWNSFKKEFSLTD